MMRIRVNHRDDILSGKFFLALFYLYVSLIVFFCFFFFQAEDGIRDRTVTGVQTCALPILRALDAFGNIATGFTDAVAIALGSNPGGSALSGTTPVAAVSGVATFFVSLRSEERRVGKECGSGWAGGE